MGHGRKGAFVTRGLRAGIYHTEYSFRGLHSTAHRAACGVYQPILADYDYYSVFVTLIHERKRIRQPTADCLLLSSFIASEFDSDIGHQTEKLCSLGRILSDIGSAEGSYSLLQSVLSIRW